MAGPGRPRGLIMAGIALIMIAASAARAQDAETGKDLAERWCRGCHVVGPASGGSDEAPPFRQIAPKAASDPDKLRAWLVNPHPPMPDPGLTTRQIEDIIAYIRSLHDG